MTPRFPNFFSPEMKNHFGRNDIFRRVSGSLRAFSKRRIGKRRRKKRIFVCLFRANFFQGREGVIPFPAVNSRNLERHRETDMGGDANPSLWVLLLPWDGEEEGSGPAEVPGVPCLEWENSLELSRREQDTEPRESKLGGHLPSLQWEIGPSQGMLQERRETPPSFPDHVLVVKAQTDP